ncbi:MAG: sulfotransferase [Streptosporangiales bacterium]|nr:sulfotransferase [Streptosporangiales bacterium]
MPIGLQRAVRGASRTYGRLTHGARMLPSFLIVGAQRCGTTSLYKTITQHPAVLPAVLHKGVHYFDTGYERGSAWYQGHFPLELAARRVERASGVRPATGESSPYYMFHPLAGERIAADLPGVKLLVLLRDPVERAYSAHAHESARGFETEPFERAIELEPQRLAGEVERILGDPGYHGYHHQHHAYLARGRYIEQLERLEAIFGRGSIHVVDSGDLFEDPEPVLAGIVEFLGLPSWRPSRFDRHNARPRSAMAGPLRARLDEYFREYDERLAGWLGREPSWRR